MRRGTFSTVYRSSKRDDVSITFTSRNVDPRKLWFVDCFDGHCRLEKFQEACRKKSVRPTTPLN